MVLSLKNNSYSYKCLRFVMGLMCFCMCVVTISEVRADDVRYSHDKILVSLFSSALDSLSKGDLIQSQMEISSLKEEASKLGYSELSEFSYRILRAAKVHKGSLSERKQIVQMAEFLSPNHPGVMLTISSNSDLFGTMEQLAYLKNGVLNLVHYPLTSLSILSRLMVVLAVAGVLATFSVFLLILIASISELAATCGRLFNRKNKKVGGPVVFILAVIGPLFLPLNVAMVIWAAFLVLAMPRFWWLGMLISFYAIYVDFLLIPTSMLISFAESPSSRALESMANEGFVPRVMDYVDDEIQKESDSPVWHFILGHIFQTRGDDVKGLESYENAKHYLDGEKSISSLISFNEAIYSFRRGDTQLAFDELMALRREGWKQFELLYDISLASSILHNSEVYEAVFKEMQQSYPTRLAEILATQGDVPSPILSSLPNDFFMEMLRHQVSHIYTVSKEGYGNAGLIKLGLYLSVFILGAFKGATRKSLRYSRTFISQRLFIDVRRNKFWSYIPMGWAIREGRLFLLYAYINILVLIAILISAKPIKLFFESDGGLSILYLLIFGLLILGLKHFNSEVQDA